MPDPITQAQIWHVLVDRVLHSGIGLVAICHDDPLLDVAAGRVVDLSASVRPLVRRTLSR